MKKSLAGKVALVAGATRGAGRGIAIELGAAGATVYVTGRTTRDQPSEYARPETIEETAELVSASGGVGIAVRVDHLVPDEVEALGHRIRTEQGRLDVIVNDIWGGENLKEWDTPVWKHNLQNGLRLLRLGIETHLITAHHDLPLLIERPGGLLIEVTDGTAEYNEQHYRINPFYDLAKVAVTRMAWAHAKDLAPYGDPDLSRRLQPYVPNEHLRRDPIETSQLHEYLMILRYRWKLIAGFTVAGLVMKGIVSLMSRPLYTAQSLLFVGFGVALLVAFWPREGLRAAASNKGSGGSKPQTPPDVAQSA